MRSMALAKKSRSRLAEMVRGVFHHVGDQLAHKPVELLVDEVVSFQDVQRRLGIEASKGIERLRNRPEARSAAMRRSLEATNGLHRFR